MKNSDNYYFPDTEKVGDIIFHYSARINGSFVKEVKKDIEVAISKLKKYKNINLRDTMKADPMHVFIYPDIKSFKMVFGQDMQKLETKQMHFMMSNSVETRYILTDEMGNIHMVLPKGRTNSMYTTFSAELVSKIVGQYIDVDQKKEYELKSTIKSYIKVERKKEQEELEEQKELEDADEEEKLQQELEQDTQEKLEELSENEIEEELAILSEMTEQEVENMAETQQELEKKEQPPSWMIYGWRAYICNRLQSKANMEKFKKIAEKKEIPKPTSITGKKIDSELDLDVATLAVEYIVNTYGYNAFIKLSENPENVKGIFYASSVLDNKTAKEKLNSEIKEYIKLKLKPVKIIEVTEITGEEAKVLFNTKDAEIEKKLEV